MSQIYYSISNRTSQAWEKKPSITPLTLNQRSTQTNFFPSLPPSTPNPPPSSAKISWRISRACARASRRAFERVVRVRRASSASSRIRLLFEEGAFTSASAGQRRPSAAPFVSPTRWNRTVEGVLAPRCFPSNEQPFFPSVRLSPLDDSVPRFNDRREPLSRYSVSQRRVDYAAVSDRGGWPKGVREERDDRARAIQRLAAPREKAASWGRKPRVDSGVQALWGRKFRYVGEEWVVDSLRSTAYAVSGNRETMFRGVCRLLWSFSSPLVSLSPLRKIFLSSCLRSRLKNSCCVASLRFESGNGLSFRRNGRRWVLFKTGLFPLSCFRSSSSHVSDWKNLGICCVLSLKVWVWKKIKFRKMKGGGYCLDWDWIFCWFFLFFFFVEIFFVSRRIRSVIPSNL